MSSPGPDIDVQRLQFQRGSHAVITSVEDSTTVTWSASIGLGTFIDVVDSILDLEPTSGATAHQVGEEGYLELNPYDIAKDSAALDLDPPIDLYRIDLSDFRSVAWHRFETAWTLVGFGDLSTEVASAEGLLRRLIEATATPELDVTETVSAVVTIAGERRSKGEPFGSGA